MRSSARFGRDQDSASRIGAGQWRARRHGNAGIHGKVGIVESITCRIYRGRLSSNPTLSATSFELCSQSVTARVRLPVCRPPPCGLGLRHRIPLSPPTVKD
jgi:hypothetical protein